MKILGRHIILELYDCQANCLADPKVIEQVIREAAERAEATIISSHFHHFAPLGVSGVLIISESHITIHTWPEHNYAAVDMFSCGEIKDEAAVDYLAQALGAQRREVKELQRGKLENL